MRFQSRTVPISELKRWEKAGALRVNFRVGSGVTMNELINRYKFLLKTKPEFGRGHVESHDRMIKSAGLNNKGITAQNTKVRELKVPDLGLTYVFVEFDTGDKSVYTYKIK